MASGEVKLIYLDAATNPATLTFATSTLADGHTQQVRRKTSIENIRIPIPLANATLFKLNLPTADQLTVTVEDYSGWGTTSNSAKLHQLAKHPDQIMGANYLNDVQLVVGEQTFYGLVEDVDSTQSAGMGNRVDITFVFTIAAWKSMDGVTT